jgi:hypothetical protein
LRREGKKFGGSVFLTQIPLENTCARAVYPGNSMSHRKGLPLHLYRAQSLVGVVQRKQVLSKKSVMDFREWQVDL